MEAFGPSGHDLTVISRSAATKLIRGERGGFFNRGEVIAFGQQLNTLIADPNEQVAFAGSNESDAGGAGELAAVEDRQRVAQPALRGAGNEFPKLAIAGPHEDPEQNADDGE